MGSLVYDFLTQSFLFDDSNLREGFKSVSESDLRKELTAYRDFILKNIAAIEGEILDCKSELKLLSGIKKLPYHKLIQSAFYVEQYILYDPLFPFTREESDTSKVYMEFLKADESFDISGLVDTLKYLKAISYLVAKDYVKILPISYLQEPKEDLAIHYSENLYSDVLPRDILKFFYENAKVESMKMDGNYFALQNRLYPCRSIHVSFPREGYEYNMFYNLFETEVTKYDPQSHVAQFVQRLPDTPPDGEQFKYWVIQSVNQAARHVFDQLYLENKLAARYGASYMASSDFAFQLIGRSLKIKEGINDNTANLLMNLDLPFLERLDAQILLDIRNNDGEAFANFRINLDKHLRELRTIEDPSVLEKKFENAIHEISEVQVNEVNQKVAQLKRQARYDAVILIGGLLGAIPSGGITLIGAALAAAKGFKDWDDYFQHVKAHPAYFLWKVKQKSGK